MDILEQFLLTTDIFSSELDINLINCNNYSSFCMFLKCNFITPIKEKSSVPGDRTNNNIYVPFTFLLKVERKIWNRENTDTQYYCVGLMLDFFQPFFKSWFACISANTHWRGRILSDWYDFDSAQQGQASLW